MTGTSPGDQNAESASNTSNINSFEANLGYQDQNYTMPFEQGILNYFNDAQSRVPSGDIHNSQNLPLSYPYGHGMYDGASVPNHNFHPHFTGNNNFQNAPQQVLVPGQPGPTGHFYRDSSSVATSVPVVTSSVSAIPKHLFSASQNGTSSSVTKPPKTSSGSSSKVTSVATPPVIFIENTCISFIRSQILRLDQNAAITSTVLNFGLDEIKSARESLFRNTGIKSYSYKGPHDPATQHAKAKHCVASIIAKIHELDASNQLVRYVNSAVDLFRLASMFTNGDDMEQRLRRIEMDIKYLKTTPQVQNPAAVPTPRYSKTPVSTNRQTLLKNMSTPTPATSTSYVDSPNKRRRTGESLQEANGSNAKQAEVLRDGKVNTGNWDKAEYKKNGHRPGSQSTVKGKPLNNQGDPLEVFLYRYSIDATPAAVLKHFKDEGVNAYHNRLRCHENSETKCFVMKIRSRDDFSKVVRALPEFTGCRWYVPGIPPNPGETPKRYFNNGLRITGPDVHLFFPFQVKQSSPDANMDIDTTSQPIISNTASSEPVQSAAQPIIVTSTAASTVESVSTAAKPFTTNTVTTPSTSNSILNQITPLNSPHLSASNVKYDVVIHE